MLEGQVSFVSWEDRIAGKPVIFIHMPRGNQHRFKNTSERSAKMLISLMPAGLEELFVERGRKLAKDELPDLLSPEEI